MALLYRIFVVFILLLCVETPFCAANNMLFERMGPNGQVKQLGVLRSIAQDNDGFMWFGGIDALARFDGQEFKLYNRDPADVNRDCGRFVHDLYVDSTHVLWVGTDKGFCRYDRKLDKFFVFAIPNVAAVLRGGPIREDASGNLYLGVRNGLILLDKTRLNAKLYTFPISPTSATSLTDTRTILIDSRQRIWLGTSNSGLAEFNTISGEFTFYKNHEQNPQSLASNSVLSLAEGENGKLWVAFYQDGIDLFNPTTAGSQHYDNSGNITGGSGKLSSYQLFKDSQQTLWVTSDGAGLLHYEPERDNFTHQYHQSEIDTSLISNKTVAIFEDVNQGLWITSEPYGIQYFEANGRKVLNYQKTSQPPSLNDNGILCFYERADGTILIGTEQGINLYNPRTAIISEFTDSQTPIAKKPVTHIVEDYQGNTWISTWDDGLYRVTARDHAVTHYVKSDLPGALTTNIIWRILPNTDGSVWLATQRGGLVHFNPTTAEFKAYTPLPNDQESISSFHLNEVIKDRRGDLWVGGYGGVDRMNLATGRLHHLPLTFLPSIRIRALHEDTKGRIWIATEDAGIFIWQNDHTPLINLHQANGLPHAYVTGIVEDAQQNIWAATLRGLVAIDPVTLISRPFSQNYGISAYRLYRGALLASRHSGLYVGGIEGFSRFNPQDLSAHGADFPVYLTKLIVNNSAILPAENSALLSTNISFTETLHLDHHQGSVAFAFAGLNYHLADANHYHYMLEGFDREWNDSAGQNLVTYANISPGTYHFRVKAANGSSTWSTKEVNLAVIVAPPPWKTWWAYCLYGVIFFAISYQWYRHQRDKIEFDKEKRLNLELVRLNRIKDEFLANTTHELRTPINGIIGLTLAIEDELQSTNKAITEKFALIVSSGRRLSHLIDDILDYAKMADADIVLHKTWVAIHALVDRVFSIAEPLAKNKNLTFLNATSISDGKIFVDPNRIEQILLNLVSNAIKYTDSGVIKVFVCLEAEAFTLVVQDSGIGIAEKDIEKLFSAFSQLEDSASRRMGGTGLGLTVTKHLIEKHGGSIQVNSIVGEGSQFIMRLPAEHHALAEPVSPMAPASRQTPSLAGLTVLIADDDAVNCLVLRNQLNKCQATLLEAHNGREAWTILRDNPHLDAVILDLHMPYLGGFEVAKLMRTQAHLAGTPILFLTASIQDADREAARFFAPAHIDLKPIRQENLIERISLLCGRQDN